MIFDDVRYNVHISIYRCKLYHKLPCEINYTCNVCINILSYLFRPCHLLARKRRAHKNVGDTDFSCHFHSTASKKEEVIRENAAIIYTNAPLVVSSLTCASAWWSSAHSATLERPAGTRERFRLG